MISDENKRNDEISFKYFCGSSIINLSREYNLSRQRIFQIVNKYFNKFNNEILKKIRKENIFLRDRKNINIVFNKTSKEHLLKYSQVADILQCSEVTVRRLVMLKKIPFYKIGGSVRFSFDEILIFSKTKSYTREDKIL